MLMSLRKDVLLTVRFPADLYARLCYRAEAEGIPLSHLVRSDLERATDQWQPPAPSTSGLSIRWPDEAP